MSPATGAGSRALLRQLRQVMAEPGDGQQRLRFRRDLFESQFLGQFQSWSGRHVEELIHKVCFVAVRDLHRVVGLQELNPVVGSEIFKVRNRAAAEYESARHNQLGIAHVAGVQLHLIGHIGKAGFIRQHFIADAMHRFRAGTNGYVGADVLMVMTSGNAPVEYLHTANFDNLVAARF